MQSAHSTSSISYALVSNDVPQSQTLGVDQQQLSPFQLDLLTLLKNEVLFHFMLLADKEKKRSRFWSSRPIRNSLELYKVSMNGTVDAQLALYIQAAAQQLSMHDTEYNFFSEHVNNFLDAARSSSNAEQPQTNGNLVGVLSQFNVDFSRKLV